jgi:hypothetical protein
LPITDFRLLISYRTAKSEIGNWQSEMSLGFLVVGVLTAAPAELPKLQTIRSRLLVLCRRVVPALTINALQYDVVTRHKLKSPISDLKFEI